MTYQWLKSDWLKIPAATRPTFSISNAGPNDVDTYTVTASPGTNSQGVDSARATLEIGPSLSFRKPELVIHGLYAGGRSFASRRQVQLGSCGFPVSGRRQHQQPASQ
ncbi:MAG TPA: hypothetical protein VMA35_09150 [Candidatus Sulfopaludibacter sp.]|nr:hypothetical protein [Candidatus Sulfopaludibacter sp.]